MRLCRFVAEDGNAYPGVVDGTAVFALNCDGLTELLLSPDPAAAAQAAVDRTRSWPLERVRLLAPVERQEVWAAGVTYKRSEEARKLESHDAGFFYEKVYRAERPELFLKATPERVVGPGGQVRIRSDTKWCVPEPELAVFVTPSGDVVAYTIGDDVSCRDIEGENPLYLPQAKVFADCCALGPVLVTADEFGRWDEKTIRMEIVRDERVVYEGQTGLDQMARSPEDLARWLVRDQRFRQGVFLLTGTGIIPPDDFSLCPGDRILIRVDGIGILETGTYREP